MTPDQQQCEASTKAQVAPFIATQCSVLPAHRTVRHRFAWNATILSWVLLSPVALLALLTLLIQPPQRPLPQAQSSVPTVEVVVEKRNTSESSVSPIPVTVTPPPAESTE